MKRYYFIIALFLTVNSVSVMAQNQQDSLLNVENLHFPNSNKEMVELFISGAFDTTLICNNTEAIRIFEQRIDTLKNYISDKNTTSITNVFRLILNFELLTGIESESDANYIGKYNPTNVDLEKWIKWFEEHQDYLCWYRKKTYYS